MPTARDRSPDPIEMEQHALERAALGSQRDPVPIGHPGAELFGASASRSSVPSQEPDLRCRGLSESPRRAIRSIHGGAAYQHLRGCSRERDWAAGPSTRLDSIRARPGTLCVEPPFTGEVDHGVASSNTSGVGGRRRETARTVASCLQPARESLAQESDAPVIAIFMPFDSRRSREDVRLAFIPSATVANHSENLALPQAGRAVETPQAIRIGIGIAAIQRVTIVDVQHRIQRILRSQRPFDDLLAPIPV